MIEQPWELGFVHELPKWEQQQLIVTQRQRRVKAAVSLLSFRCSKTRISLVFTGDETHVQYTNIQRKCSWCPPSAGLKTTASPELYPKKACCQCDRTSGVCACLNCCLPPTALLHSCNAKNWIIGPPKCNASIRTTARSDFSATTHDPT